MKTTINKIEHELNGSLSSMSDKKLEQLFYNLWYEGDYQAFILNDLEGHTKTNQIIRRLIDNVEDQRLQRVIRKGIIEEPYDVMVELKIKNDTEKREIVALLVTTHLLHIYNESETFSELLEYINKGFDERATLEFVKKTIWYVKESVDRILLKNQDIVLELLDFYGCKEDLNEHDGFILEKLTEIKEMGDQ